MEMRRFHFPLERLLRLRRQRERVARRELAVATAELGRLSDKQAALTSLIEHCRVEAGRAAPLARGLERGLARARTQVTAQLATAEIAADRIRRSYTDRRRDLRALDRLRSRRFEAWRVTALAADQAEIEEVSRLQSVCRRREEDRA